MAKVAELIDELNDLESLIQDRITENNSFSDHIMNKESTHAFILYRSKIWRAIELAERVK